MIVGRFASRRSHRPRSQASVTETPSGPLGSARVSQNARVAVKIAARGGGGGVAGSWQRHLTLQIDPFLFFQTLPRFFVLVRHRVGSALDASLLMSREIPAEMAWMAKGDEARRIPVAVLSTSSKPSLLS